MTVVKFLDVGNSFVFTYCSREAEIKTKDHQWGHNFLLLNFGPSRIIKSVIFSRVKAIFVVSRVSMQHSCPTS